MNMCDILIVIHQPRPDTHKMNLAVLVDTWVLSHWKTVCDKHNAPEFC